jgi:hypothetical protein
VVLPVLLSVEHVRSSLQPNSTEADAISQSNLRRRNGLECSRTSSCSSSIRTSFPRSSRLQSQQLVSTSGYYLSIYFSDKSLIGAFLSLFLARDGGPRGGAIQLPEKPFDLPETIVEEDEDVTAPPTPTPEARSPGAVGSLSRRLGKKFSGYFSSKGAGGAAISPGSPAPSSVPLGIPGPRGRASSAGAGSAYGYTSISRARLASINAASIHRGGLAASLARRRASIAAADAAAMGVQPGTSVGASVGRPSFAGSTADLTFAQRLLLANENAVTNIADLWVASAMNVDNEEVFESDVEDEEDLADASFDTEPTGSGFTATTTNAGGSSFLSPGESSTRRQSPSRPRGLSTRRGSASTARATSAIRLGPEDMAARRMSAAIPAIFQNAGLRTPPALLDTPQMQPLSLLPDTTAAAPEGHGEEMPTIFESRPVSIVRPPEAAAGADEPIVEEKLWAQLPIAIIVQYGLIALHTTTHDQVFLSYLVSPFEAGGLNLNPGHFAQLSTWCARGPQEVGG